MSLEFSVPRITFNGERVRGRSTRRAGTELLIGLR